MSRRSRDWRWRASATSDTARISSGNQGLDTSAALREKDSARNGDKEISFDKDEWLRQDMLQHYGREKVPDVPSSVPPLPTSPTLVSSSPSMLRSTESQQTMDSYKILTPQSSPPPQQISPDPMEEVRRYVPGRLTGHPYFRDAGPNSATQAIRPGIPRSPFLNVKPDIKATVRAAKERFEAARSRSSPGSMVPALASDEAHGVGHVSDAERLIEKEDGVQTTADVVPSIPPRSSDHVGPRDRQI